MTFDEEVAAARAAVAHASAEAAMAQAEYEALDRLRAAMPLLKLLDPTRSLTGQLAAVGLSPAALGLADGDLDLLAPFLEEARAAVRRRSA